ncbi:unnamed protein product [Rotaria sordida]|uniref:GIY-YIG domain-containing protein n=1 Tax=Rotaria sordida TaxID=392033 RepID=A0A819SEC0_9BILA|nr:unnamed protein product [Rotaria sordida]CAF1449988.1 unnamed protein product [Rotaria sordida]CAF3834572.1 unnamed protein product [Rotaria sordida]CAF4058047.1 unnamed protein product [Rotaria sordida]
MLRNQNQILAFDSISHSLLQVTSLSSSHSARYSILPVYPTTDNKTDRHPLLTNVPMHHLNRQESERRSANGYHQPSLLRPINDHERRIFFLSRLWNVNKEILEYNFIRLKTLNNMIATNRIRRFSTQFDQEYLNENEYSFALELFLQIDVDLFYMKTCSYRGAEPIIDVPNGLFCVNEPQARYEMMRCSRFSCCLCHPSYKLTYRQEKPIIQFGPNQQHRFINGYRSILNCPATCTTNNIIYVLTCPCHQIDYIGETSLSLPNRLSYHQAHGNRILQEFLLGPKNTSKIRTRLKSFETLVKDDMKLYQHSARCSSAIQWFLDENPEYWPFVPTPNDIEEKTTEIDSYKSSVELDTYTYANDVPSPSANHRFTHRQKLGIEQFFREEKYLNSPNQRLDLYQAAIVAVLPINATAALRRIIEALFITHADTQMNTEGHLDKLWLKDSVTHQRTSESVDWCRNLLRRPC